MHNRLLSYSSEEERAIYENLYSDLFKLINIVITVLRKQVRKHQWLRSKREKIYKKSLPSVLLHKSEQLIYILRI